MRARSCLPVLRAFPLIVFLAVAGRGAPLSAQSATTVVTGTVSDTSGGVLPSATVEAVVAGEIVAATSTGPDGRYEIGLTRGRRHRLRARRDGFAEATVEVPAGAGTVRRDFQLQLAAVSDAVVVTASRTPEHRALAPASVSVFTAADVAALGSRSLSDLLAWVPGINVDATGREGAQTSLFARGGESDYNLVLVDGVQVNLNGGQFDFGRVAAAEVDRVEVVRGAQSALYGSDAIGSVVQIFTRRGQPANRPRLSGSIEGGTFKTARGRLSLLGGARRRLDYQAGASYRGTEGAFADRLVDRDRFDQTAFNGSVGTIVGDSATIRTGLRYSTARGRSVGQIAYGPGDTGTTYATRDLSWHLDVSQRLSDAVTQTISATYFTADTRSSDAVADPTFNVYAILRGTPGAMFPASPRLVRLIDESAFADFAAGRRGLGPGEFLAYTAFGVSDFTGAPFETHFRRPTASYQIDARWLGQLLTAGYEFDRERDPVAGFGIDNHAYFVQQQLDVADRWTVALGARVNANSRFGTEVTPKVSAGGYLRPFTPGAISSLKVFTNFGTGIKNPTFDELFGGEFADGNPDLHAERARTVDAGVEATFDDQRWLGRAAFFDNRYRDQVAFFSSSFLGLDGIPDFVNVSGSTARGAELELHLQRPVGGVTGAMTYAFVDTEVTSSLSTSRQFQPGQPLLRRPKHSASVRLTYTSGRVSVHGSVRHVGARHDSSFLFLSTLDFTTTDITVNPGYTLMGLGGDVRLGSGLTVFLRLANLTDEVYETALGFPGLPRSAMVGARFALGR